MANFEWRGWAGAELDDRARDRRSTRRLARRESTKWAAFCCSDKKVRREEIRRGYIGELGELIRG